MKTRFFLTAAALLMSTFAAGCGSSPLCPADWEEYSRTPGHCVATDGYVADLEAKHGSGVYGYGKWITGGCGPGDHSCKVGLMNNEQVRVFELSAIDPADNASCDVDAEALGLSPFASAITDSEGTYALALEPGEYCMGMTDPIEGGERLRKVVVEADTFTDVVFVFDWGGY